MFQLTQLTVASALNIQYNYSATQNNGKIASQSDVISGEQIAYTYDALNRLATARTTQTGGTQWGQSYTYDGFGNLTDQTVTKGSAPDVHVAYNYLTNRQTSDTADANGNIGSGNIYDRELTTAVFFRRTFAAALDKSRLARLLSHRGQVHKKRNVVDHLPDEHKADVRRKMQTHASLSSWAKASGPNCSLRRLRRGRRTFLQKRGTTLRGSVSLGVVPLERAEEPGGRYLSCGENPPWRASADRWRVDSRRSEAS